MPDLVVPNSIDAGTPLVAAELQANFAAIQTAINDLDEANLASALAAVLGVSQSGLVRRGKSIIATAESRSNTAYDVLATPDRVSGLVLPTDGLILMAYHATWENSNANAGRAAIFLGGTQTKMHSTNGSVEIAETSGPTATARKSVLYSTGSGLDSASGALNYDGPVTTGEIIGSGQAFAGTGPSGMSGFTAIFAAAGTYDLSIRFKATAGSVTVSNRKLWAMAIGF